MLLARIDTLPPAIARRLTAARDYLDAARRVVLPVATVPLPRVVDLGLPTAPAHPRTLARLGQEHRLTNAIGRVRAALGHA